MKTNSLFLLALMCSVLLGGCQSQQLPELMRIDRSFEFGLIGDAPYTEEELTEYERMMASLNRYEQLKWVVHMGDVKGSRESCSDVFLQSRYDLNQMIEAPLVVTPGDNDWFDCSRKQAGEWDPEDRLKAFRRIFYPSPGVSSGQRRMPVNTQAAVDPTFPDMIENARWERANVIFATVHIVGNSPSQPGQGLLAYQMEAGLAWIRSTFEYAREQKAKGVFIAFHVDPWLLSGPRMDISSICQGCQFIRPGYEELDNLLTEEARRYRRPIAIAVGDTHVFRVDKPLYYDDRMLLVEHATRVESFGSPHIHWVRVKVDPDAVEVFQFHQQLIMENFGPTR